MPFQNQRLMENRAKQTKKRERKKTLLNLLLLPRRYRGLSWGHHTIGTRSEMHSSFSCTFTCEFQAHKTEQLLTCWADNIFTLFFVMLHQHATGGTSTDAGTTTDIIHRLKDDIFTVFQYLKCFVGAANIVTAV